MLIYLLAGLIFRRDVLFQQRISVNKTCKSTLSYMLKSVQLDMQVKYSRAKASRLFISPADCHGTAVAPADQRNQMGVWLSVIVWIISYQKRQHIHIERIGLWLLCFDKLRCCIWIWIAKISTNVIVESHRPWFMSMTEKPQKVWRFPVSTQSFGYFSSFSQTIEIRLFEKVHVVNSGAQVVSQDFWNVWFQSEVARSPLCLLSLCYLH